MSLAFLSTGAPADAYFHARFGRLHEALKAAESALLCAEKPIVQMFMQKAFCEIKLGLLDDAAATLVELEASFPRKRVDWRLQLEARLALARKNGSKAINSLNKLTDKTAVLCKLLRRDAIEMVLSHDAIPDEQRAIYKAEINVLISELGGALMDENLGDLISSR